MAKLKSIEDLQLSKKGYSKLANLDREKGLNLISKDLVASVSSSSFKKVMGLTSDNSVVNQKSKLY